MVRLLSRSACAKTLCVAFPAYLADSHVSRGFSSPSVNLSLDEDSVLISQILIIFGSVNGKKFVEV